MLLDNKKLCRERMKSIGHVGTISLEVLSVDLVMPMVIDIVRIEVNRDFVVGDSTDVIEDKDEM